MANDKSPTHSDLVKRAALWLRNSRGCPVVVTELDSAGCEIPDAIGWQRGWMTIVVECKTSRADFRADLKKNGRRNHRGGIGDLRYYLTPPGLIATSELPEGWGLLECHQETVRCVSHLPDWARQEKDWRSEMTILVSALRRLGVKSDGGVSVKVYTVQTKCRSGLYVEPDDEQQIPLF